MSGLPPLVTAPGQVRHGLGQSEGRFLSRVVERRTSSNEIGIINPSSLVLRENIENAGFPCFLTRGFRPDLLSQGGREGRRQGRGKLLVINLARVSGSGRVIGATGRWRCGGDETKSRIKASSPLLPSVPHFSLTSRIAARIMIIYCVMRMISCAEVSLRRLSAHSSTLPSSFTFLAPSVPKFLICRVH